jgi:hypothetical protein
LPGLWFDPAEPYAGLEADPERWELPVVVSTQACDLAETKTSRILVATIHVAGELVQAGAVKPAVVRNDIRRGRVYGWYFLPACQQPITLPESLVDLRDLHTVPKPMLEDLARSGKRIGRIVTPYREHLAQHFAVTYMRIGLPEPYETQP